MKVTVGRLQRQFIYLRKLSKTLVEERLQDADIHYLRRRSKCIVTKDYLEARIDYCQSVKRKHDSTLLCVVQDMPHNKPWADNTPIHSCAHVGLKGVVKSKAPGGFRTNTANG